MGETERRRRRLRTSSSAAAAADPATGAAPADETPLEVTAPAAETAPILDPVEESVEERAPTPQRPPRATYPGRPPRPAGAGAANGDDREAERGLRGLVGSGSSQVSVGAAMRARDAARPTDEHLADADENLVIVRRNWQPREDLPHNR
jgi:hypothetical protein